MQRKDREGEWDGVGQDGLRSQPRWEEMEKALHLPSRGDQGLSQHSVSSPCSKRSKWIRNREFMRI